jgi:glucose-6-phosphate 1-dehydrogenase
MTVAMAVSVSPLVEGGGRKAVEMVASRHPRPGEMEAYERVLTDAMAGDATLFARQDYVEEAWRIVDPVLKETTPVYPYAPQTWGPKEVDQTVVPPGGWDEPTAEDEEDFRVIGEADK